MMRQLELFPKDPMEHLFPYWRDSLRQGMRDALLFRHHADTSGWSMARQSWFFATCLFRHGQITRSEYRRWWRFGRRMHRWTLAYRKKRKERE